MIPTMPWNSRRRDFFTASTVLAAGLYASPKLLARESQLFPGFETRKIRTPEVQIHAVTGGAGPPLLLLHGFPESHVSWHRIASRLAERFTVVIPDLRGYGDSGKAADGENHAGYAKRAMARDQVETMRSLGFERFAVVGHDRGARVGWRLALERPQHVTRLAVLDIVPNHYSNVTREFATEYFHWFFLIQPAPFPEQLIAGNPEAFLRRFLPAKSIAPETFAEYLRCLRHPGAIHAMCEDYRAGASIDLAHEEETKGKQLQCPLLVLWGERSVIARLSDVMQEWRGQGSDIRGKALPAAHHLAEEAPEQTLTEVLAFLGS